MIGQVKLAEITKLFQKLHDDLNHPNVNMIQMELRLRNLTIPNWRTHYRETRKECRVYRKCNFNLRGARRANCRKNTKDNKLVLILQGFSDLKQRQEIVIFCLP